jgi:hypothetical protein
MNDELATKTFQRFVDRQRMKIIFQEQLPEYAQEKLVITCCKILHTHYKIYLEEKTRHRSFFVACYRLEISDSYGQRQGEQLLCAKAYLNGRSALKFSKIDRSQLCPPRFGAPVVHLPALDMIVWAFPNDPDLLHLPKVVDPQQVRPYLPATAFLLGGAGSQTDVDADINVEIVRYKPGKRCTICYDLNWAAAGCSQPISLFGKLFVDHKGRAVYQWMMRLWQRSLARPDAFGVAQPLGYQDEIQIAWQAALPGVPLLDLINGPDEAMLIRAVARGLADLHRSELAPPARQTIGDHLAAAHEEATELMKAYPLLTPTLQTLLTSIERSAPVLPSVDERPIHRDFHIKQLLVQDGKLFIFDFDDFSTGDPMQDLAFFIVDLHYRDLKPGLVNRLASTLFHTYREAAEWPAPLARLNWHIQRQFLTKAYWFFKKRQLSLTITQELSRTLTLAQCWVVG